MLSSKAIVDDIRIIDLAVAGRRFDIGDVVMVHGVVCNLMPLFEGFCKKIGALRHPHPHLKKGCFRTISLQDVQNL